MGKQVKKHGYTCKLVRVVDGDTCDAMIDLGFNVWVKERIRFYGVDTWESRTRDLEEKKKGLAAKEYVKDLLENSIKILNEREKNILYSRRLSDEPKTLEELSKKFKISRERVRQVENKAFEKLQKHMLNAAKSKNLLPVN